MNLIVVTVVKDDLLGLIKTENSIDSQDKSVSWIVVTPFDDSDTHKHCQNLLMSGKVFKLLQDQGDGVYSAMNQAIFDSSEKDWLWFLNAGDEFIHSNSYSRVIEEIQKVNSRWIFGGHRLSSESSKTLGDFKSPNKFKISNQLFAKRYISHQATVFQVGFLHLLNGFNTTFRVAADWDLMARASLIEPPARLDFLLCNFYMGGLSTKARQLSNLELLKIRSKYLPFWYIPKSYWWFFYRIFRNKLVQTLEGKFPEFTNSMRTIRIRIKNTKYFS